MYSQTANGRTTVRVLRADVVEVGGNAVRGALVAINPVDFGSGFDVLLGMSFLKHFEVKVEGSSMTLRRR
jgi:predicted aspartyl protease